MNRRYIQLICTLLIGTSVWGAQALGKSDDKKAIQKEIDQERSRLLELNEEIRETQKKAKKVKSEQDSVLKTIENLDQKLKQKQDAYQQTSQQLKKRDSELAELNGQLADIRQWRSRNGATPSPQDCGCSIWKDAMDISRPYSLRILFPILNDEWPTSPP